MGGTIHVILLEEFARCSHRMCLRPERGRKGQGVEIVFGPPIRFVGTVVNLAVVRPAERDRVFIADLAAKRARLREPKMMWIGCSRPQIRQAWPRTNLRCALS